MWVLDLFYAGLESYLFSVGYDLSNIGIQGLSATVSYGTFKQSDEAIANLDKYEANLDGASEYDLVLKYAFQGTLDGLSATAWMGAVTDAPATGPNATDKEDMQHIRFRLTYAF